jgi:hypothetical protein
MQDRAGKPRPADSVGRGSAVWVRGRSAASLVGRSELGVVFAGGLAPTRQKICGWCTWSGGCGWRSESGKARGKATKAIGGSAVLQERAFTGHWQTGRARRRGVLAGQWCARWPGECWEEREAAFKLELAANYRQGRFSELKQRGQAGTGLQAWQNGDGKIAWCACDPHCSFPRQGRFPSSTGRKARFHVVMRPGPSRIVGSGSGMGCPCKGVDVTELGGTW